MYETETILLQRFASTGDAEAFSEIVKRYADMVYSASLRVLADADAAADATQETFYQLLQNASAVTGSVSGWLHRVATRKAIDRIRRDSSRRKREAKYAADKTVNAEKWQDISPVVDEAMDELEDHTRRILIEHFFDGKTMIQIAVAHDISQPTVSRTIEGGVEKLRSKFKHRGIIAGVATLTALLAANTAEAAPATVMTELGKMALVGTTSATAAVGTTAAATKAAATTILTATKIKIITAAAVAVTGAGALITYNHLTNRDKSPETVATVKQTTPQLAATGSVISANNDSTDDMTKEEFEKWFFGETLDDNPADSTDVQQPGGGFAMGGAQIEDTQPAGRAAQPTASGGMMGTMGRFGGAFAPRFDTPEATVSSFVQILSMRDMDRIATCFVEGADDLDDLRRIMEYPQTEGDLKMKLVFESIGPPVEIVDIVEHANGCSVTWLSTVKQEFSIGSMTFQPGDKFELDGGLAQIGTDWKITGI